MADQVRVSVTIDGVRIQENDISSLSLFQPIGAHHHFKIFLRQDVIAGLLGGKASAWIGKPIIIGFDYASDLQLLMSPLTERFVGIVTETAISRRAGRTALVVKGASPTVVLDNHPQTRSFSEKTLEAIVNEVTKESAGKFSEIKLNLKEHQSTIPYSVQYRESNYNYLVRLAAWYGEWCYYDGKKLMFGDDPTANPPIVLDFGQQGLKEFNVTSRTAPGKFKLKAYNYEDAEVNDESAPGSVTSDDAGTIAISESNASVYQGESTNALTMSLPKEELKRIAKRTEQMSQGNVTIATGSSRNPNLHLGAIIEVNDGSLGDTYGSFIVTSLSHSVTQGGNYHNSFEAVSAKAKTPVIKAAIIVPECPPQLATVTNFSDSAGLGRVKVKMQWQEGTPEETPWIRVCTPYMGGDKGFYIIPEVGDQVLVAFEESNPEYPYVLTGMYHGKAKPQWFDNGNRYKGFHSKGNNIMKFDDDSRHILLSAPTAMDIFAGTTINMKTGGAEDSSITIDAGEGTININAKVINVTAAERIFVESGEDIQITSANSYSMNANQTMAVVAGDSLTVGTTDLSMEGSSSVAVSGAEVDVNGSGKVVVSGGNVDING